MESTDVAIVGGGIAGLTLAKFLAGSMDCILIEEHKEFGQKACGEGIFESFKGYKFIDLYESKKGIERRMDGIQVKTNIGDAYFTFPFFTTDKKTVEETLALQAKKEGAKIELGHRVTEITREDGYFVLHPLDIKAKFLVGADGLHSTVRKYLGLPTPPFGVCVTGRFHGKMPPDAVVDFTKLLPGYSWFFPKRNEWNIGAGTDVRHVHLLKRFQQGFSTVKDWTAGAVPTGVAWRSHGENVILLGDAAPQILPMAEGGILPSMIAAKVSAELLAKNKSALEIDRAWRRVMWDTLLLAWMYQWAFYNTLSPIAQHAPWLVKRDSIIPKVIAVLEKIVA